MKAAYKSQLAKASDRALVAPKDSRSRRTPTKTDQLLAMLKTADGVSIEDISNALGWLQHTTRAALTGLRKKGHSIVRTKQGSVTVYQISE